MLVNKIFKNQNVIPVQLTEQQFNEFILPNLSPQTRGPAPKVSRFKIFNYLLFLDHTGVQWKQLPIDKTSSGKPEIHYTRVFKIYQRWLQDGTIQRIFENSVLHLNKNRLLDLSILHGDGTTTAAKKRGDGIGFNGHKKIKGDKIVAFVDRNCNVISPCTIAPGNQHETTLLEDAVRNLKGIFKKIGSGLAGTIASLDSAYDSFANRKLIFNCGMVPNIKENVRNRIKVKQGPRRFYEEWIFEERFYY